MPKKIGKIWTPIDTSNQQEVEKHPLKARVQEFRDGWLKLRNDFLTTKSARILLPKVETNSKAEQLRRCLSRLSEDFSKGRNRQTALTEISKFMTSAGRWDSTVEDLDPAATYIANQLQQLRKNSKLLLKDGDLSDNQRRFLTAIFERVDSDLVMKKGYAHSKLPDPPSPAYVPLRPPDEKGFVEIDLASNTPVPEPELAPPKQPPSEQELLAEIEPHMAAYEPPPPPADAPPPLPGVKLPDVVVDHAPDPPVDGAPRELEALESIEQETKADAEIRTPQIPATVVEQQTSEKEVQDVDGDAIKKRRLYDQRMRGHRRNLSDQPIPKNRLPKPQSDSEHVPPAQKSSKRKELKPPSVRPRLMSTGAKPTAPGQEIQTPRAARPTDHGPPQANRDLRQKALFGNSVAIPLQNRPAPRDNVGDVDATPPRQAPGEAKLPDMPTPMGAQVPDWLKDFKIRDTPKERAHDLAEGLLRAIDHSQRAKGENGPKWIFLFLNRLADPALDDLVGEAIGAALASRARNNRNPGIDLHYLNSAMRSLTVRREFWELGISAQKSTRLTAILSLWEKIREPLAVSADPLDPPDFNRLMLILQSMELPAPAAAPPAPRPLRREWSQSNT